jgi:hypothetical protein
MMIVNCGSFVRFYTNKGEYFTLLAHKPEPLKPFNLYNAKTLSLISGCLNVHNAKRLIEIYELNK